MKTKEAKPEKMVEISESALLSLVASHLKDRVLFPKQIENARRILKGAQFPDSLKPLVQK